MPELPEVETVRTGLAASITGARIKKVHLARKDLRIPFPSGFAAKLAGRRITAITRRAKYLLFALDSGDVVLAHLGMSGKFLVSVKPPKTLATHDHVVWHLEDGRVVIYNDARRFGLMTLISANEISTHKLLVALGPEPLESGFSPSYLRDQLTGKKAPVKPTLMDQSLVVGVGNIYASEALFLSKIHPEREARSVAKHADILVKSIREVLKDAIISGGSSLRDFVQISGDSGYFQHHFKVYDREGEPCVACKKPIAVLRQSGRSTYFCPRCQK